MQALLESNERLTEQVRVLNSPSRDDEASPKGETDSETAPPERPPDGLDDGNAAERPGDRAGMKDGLLVRAARWLEGRWRR